MNGHQYPNRFHEWNRAHRGAYNKGVEAFANGATLDACPYGDFRKGDGRLTWSRAFQSAWRDGWRDARKQYKMNHDVAPDNKCNTCGARRLDSGCYTSQPCNDCL